jgi:hypothetical protein
VLLINIENKEAYMNPEIRRLRAFYAIASSNIENMNVSPQTGKEACKTVNDLEADMAMLRYVRSYLFPELKSVLREASKTLDEAIELSAKGDDFLLDAGIKCTIVCESLKYAGLVADEPIYSQQEPDLIIAEKSPPGSRIFAKASNLQKTITARRQQSQVSLQTNQF